MLWEAITLRKFASGSVQDHAAIERRLLGGEPRLAEAAPRVPHLLAAICDKALAVEPKDRFQTADDFREALAEYLGAYGAQFDPSAISQLMATKYAAERAQRHLLIHERIRNEHAPIESHRPVAAPANDGVPTAVADLSELVESIRLTDGVAASVRAKRKSNSKSLWWVAASAVVIGAVGTTIMGSRDAEPLPNSGSMPLVTGSLAQTLNQLTPQPEDKPRAAPAPLAEVIPTVERTLEPVKVVADADPKERKRRDKDEASRDIDEQPVAARGSAPVPSHASTSAVSTNSAPAAAKKSAPTIDADAVGKDLKTMQRREMRGLDQANPFR
jgi:hypothetical protein